MNNIKFNPTIIDNFFVNPDEIRKFGLSLPKKTSDKGDWPGYRSEPLHIIDYDFNNTLILKILSTYFDFRHVQANWEKSNITFQTIKPYDKDKNSLKNIGWVHQDNPNQLAGLIYLTPNAEPNCGTSIYKLKSKEKKNYLRYGLNTEKNTLFKSGKIKNKDYIEAIKSHNDKFVETIRIQNQYNRLLTYDGNYFHKANSFIAGKNDRLTLVFFIENIKVDKFPAERTFDEHNFDNRLTRRIKSLNL